MAIGEERGAALRAAGPTGTPRHAPALARAVAALDRLEDMPHPGDVATLVRAGVARGGEGARPARAPPRPPGPVRGGLGTNWTGNRPRCP